MSAPRIVRFLSVTVVALLASAVGVQNALAQWTYRAAPAPLIRNISVFAGNPVPGTNTLIVSTLTDGMYKGTDTGTAQSWQKISSGIPIVQVRSHTVIPPSPATNPVTDIYAATDGAGLYKTGDGGTSWAAINGSGVTALGCLNVRQIAVPVTTPTRTLIVATSCRNNSGVYRSIDDGATWTRLGPASGPGSLPVDVQSSSFGRPSSTLFFLATANYGIFKSVDDGATWATANSGIIGTNVFNTSFSGASTAELLAYVHGSGVYRSTDTGASWTPSNTGLPPGFAALGGINRQGGSQTLYIGLDKQGVYKTIDGGVSWSPWGVTASHQDAQFARNVVVDPSNTNRYYLGSLNGITKTSDNALTLNDANMPSGGRINAITHDRDTPYVAYIAAHFPLRINYIYGDYNINAMFSSLENGVTGTTNEGVVYQDRLAPATLYVSTNNRGIFKSTNNGALFTAINSGLPSMIGQTNRLAIDPTNSQILYLGLGNAAGVYKSTNGGVNWLPANNGLSSPLALSVNHVTVDGNNPAIIWIATAAGVYKSTDSAANWTLMYSAVDAAGSALPTAIVRVRQGNSNEIYIANNHANANGTLTASSGIHRSSNGGATWSQILPSLPTSQVRVTTTGDIYAGVSAQIGTPAVYLSTNGGTSFTSYSTNLQGSDIRSFGFAADDSALISLSLENGFYTNDAVLPPPSVALSAAITEAPFVFTTLYFDPQAANTTSVAKPVTVTNNSGTTANIVGFGTTSDEFAVLSHNCGSSLAPAASCTVNVVFNPFGSGDRSGTLAAIGPVSGIAVPLGGIGTSAQPAGIYAMVPGMVPAYPGLSNTANLRELSFGNQAIGTSRTLSFDLKSIGSVPLIISSVVIDLSPPFTLGGTCAGPFPLSVPAGGSCVMSVTYAPTSAGQQLANLTVNSNTTLGVAGRINIGLMGVGEDPLIDGSLVAAFGDGGRTYISSGPYGNESAESVAKQSDGKTLVLSVGRNVVENGFSIPVLTRLNLNGTLDTSWGTSGYVRLPTPVGSGASGVNEGRLYVLPGGKIIVSIDYNTPSNGNDAMVYRLLDTGVIDTTFGTAGITTVSDFIARSSLYADGRILLGGLVGASIPANNQLAFVRLTADGALDTSFGTNGRSDVFLLDALQFGQGFTHLNIAADEKILFSYPFGVGAARDIAIYRLTANGAQDTTWGTAGRVNVAATSREDNVRLTRFQSDGKLLILSRTLQPTGSGIYEVLLTRLNADGTTDTSFGVNGVVETIVGSPGSTTNLAQDMKVLPDGKIVVAGHRSALGRDVFLVRYLPSGTVDTSFGSAGVKDVALTRQNEVVRSLAIDIDGSLLVIGSTSLTDTDRGNVIGSGFVLKLRNTIGVALVNLTVSKVGNGTVTSSPAGIDCGGTCIASVTPGAAFTLTAVPASGSTFIGWSGGGCTGTGTCVTTISAATTVTATFSGGAISLLAVQSRKTHGAAGSQDIAIEPGIAISGAVTVEPRTIGTGHTIVFQFSGPVSSAAVTAKDAQSVDVGTVATAFTGNELVVTLTNVPNNRRATISVNNVNATGLNVSRTMGFLVGDVNNSRSVNPSDITAVKARSGQTTTPLNFQFDVNATGAINASDINAVKSRSGATLLP